jgi:streptogramin lyase
MEKYECKGSYSVGANGNPKGVTFDVKGNIWVGNNASIANGGVNEYRLYKFNKDGTYAWASPYYVDIENSTYGMIADAYGNIWISSGGLDGVIRIDIDDCDLSSCPISTTTGFTEGGTPYGIGMTNEGDIWTGDWTGDFVHRIDGDDDGGTLGSVVSDCEVISPSRTTKLCCTGTAVDKDNNVWTSGHSENTIYVFKGGNCGDIKSVSSVCTDSSGPAGPHGVAIDFDNNAWVVCRHGEVVKYSFDGTNITELKRINLNTGASSGTGSTASYNYSDMTGLRTVPKSISVGGISTSLSPTDTFVICTDGVEDCNDESKDAAPCNSVSLLLSAPTNCVPDEFGNCEIPFEIFSMQAGDYTLNNLEVIYGKEVPVTTGGLVPCGRDWDDPATTWDDTQPCNFCHGIMLLNQGMNFLMKIAGTVAVLAIIITGFLFITSAGNPERKNIAKTTFKWIIIGFLILSLSWLMVDFLLSAWGYLDPLGGEWNVVCD